MKLSAPSYYRLVLLLSWGALAAALVAHYGFEIKPCVLCIYERYVYLALVVIAFLGLRGVFPPVAIAFVMGAALSAGLALGVYHFGVEQHWWLGTEKCEGASLQANSIEALRAQLMQNTVRCDEVGWRILGLSAVGWNILLLAGLLFLAVMTWRYAHDKKS